MKRITSFVLGFSLVAMLSFAATGTTAGYLNSKENSTEELSDTVSYKINGTGVWKDIPKGVSCGIGFVATVVTLPSVATGVAALGWAVLASGTIAACAAALD
ncbi:MAG: hypothetical protein L0220_07655 [Acidobacteria bacterium]|nr:hypothetical protein [Acidobacteriota bacterium]